MKLILFDCDGTVLDTFLLIEKVVIKTFKKLYPTYPMTIEEAHTFFGPYIVDTLKKYTKTEEELNICLAEYQKNYDELSSTYTVVYDGMIELLDYLKQNNYKIAIVSNKKTSVVLQGLKDCKIDQYFDIIVGADLMTKAKPDPNGIFLAMNKFNIKDAYMIGDTTTDIQTGLNANIPTIGVTWCVTTKEELLKVKATYVVDHPTQIINILEA